MPPKHPDLHHSQGVKVADVLARAAEEGYVPKPGDPAYDSAVAKGFKPVTEDAIHSNAALQRQLGLLAADVKVRFDLIDSRLDNVFRPMLEKLASLDRRATQLEKRSFRHDDELIAHDKRLARLEKARLARKESRRNATKKGK